MMTPNRFCLLTVALLALLGLVECSGGKPDVFDLNSELGNDGEGDMEEKGVGLYRSPTGHPMRNKAFYIAPRLPIYPTPYFGYGAGLGYGYDGGYMGGYGYGFPNYGNLGYGGGNYGGYGNPGYGGGYGFY